MPGPSTIESRRRQSDRAYRWWSCLVLSKPESYTKLKLERYRKGMMQTELAAAINLHPGTLCALEARDRPPKSAQTQQALADALNVKIGDLW
jgi:DNA-binding XRE family transcriptional regulator